MEAISIAGIQAPPLSLQMHRDEGGWFIEIRELEVFGEGETFEEAVWNLADAVWQYWSVLEMNPDLTGDEPTCHHYRFFTEELLPFLDRLRPAVEGKRNQQGTQYLLQTIAMKERKWRTVSGCQEKLKGR